MTLGKALPRSYYSKQASARKTVCIKGTKNAFHYKSIIFNAHIRCVGSSASVLVDYSRQTISTESVRRARRVGSKRRGKSSETEQLIRQDL